MRTKQDNEPFRDELFLFGRARVRIGEQRGRREKKYKVLWLLCVLSIRNVFGGMTQFAKYFLSLPPILFFSALCERRSLLTVLASTPSFHLMISLCREDNSRPVRYVFVYTLTYISAFCFSWSKREKKIVQGSWNKNWIHCAGWLDRVRVQNEKRTQKKECRVYYLIQLPSIKYVKW